MTITVSALLYCLAILLFLLSLLFPEYPLVALGLAAFAAGHVVNR